MSGRVIVVGSVNIDLVVTTDRLPGPGETVTGGRFAQHHGGKGGNQAVAAARLGAAVSFVGAVGDDASGRRPGPPSPRSVSMSLSSPRTPAPSTGVALILVDGAGENLISVASGANGAVSPDAVTAALVRLAPVTGDVVLVGHEIPTASARAALAAGRAAGAIDDPQPGARRRPGCGHPVARRHRHAERRRGRRPRRGLRASREPGRARSS